MVLPLLGVRRRYQAATVSSLQGGKLLLSLVVGQCHTSDGVH